MAKRRWARDYTQDVVDAKRRFDDAREHIKEPPDGQIPLSDWGIYTSPNLQSNEPVSPFDCEQYPDSPYCGGSPWTKTPVGLEPEWGVDECGVWVQVNPVLGFTKLPPVSVGWRRPGKCREEEKPPPPPEPTDASRPVSPVRFPKTIDPTATVFVVLILKYKYESVFDSDRISTDSGSTITVMTEAMTSSSYPSIEMVPSYFPYGGNVLAIGSARTVNKVTTTVNRKNTLSFNEVVGNGRAWITSDQRPPSVPNFQRYTVRNLTGDYLISRLLVPGWNDANQRTGVIMHGTYGQIVKDWDNFVIDTKTFFNAGQTIYTLKEEYEIAYISFPNSDDYPPPPDQKRKRDCCMQCCSGGNQAANKQAQDNAEILRLLREIKKNIGNFPYNVQLFDSDDNKVGIQKKTVPIKTVAEGGKLAITELQRTLKAIGIDHFPIYSPSSIIEDESNGLLGDLGDLKNKVFKQKIESLAEFLVWRSKNDNEIFGTWQEVIEVQDSDPNVKGNQPKRVVLPNMAKSFKEIILLLSVLIKSQGFSMDALLKLYIDVANTKVSASVSEAILRDIQDYLDYPTNTTTLDVPLGISIPKDNDPTDDREDVERFLRNSTIKAMFDDWDGNGSLHDMMLTLLDAAARTIQKPHT